jgi:hypothetical protein
MAFARCEGGCVPYTTAPLRGGPFQEIAAVNQSMNAAIPSVVPYTAFLALVPRIEAQARCRFRGIPCPNKRDDQVAEAVALAWSWFLNLHRRGKDPARFPGTFGALVARAVASGRRLSGMEKANDVMSSRAHFRGVIVERLPNSTRNSIEALAMPRGQKLQDALEERLRDNTLTPVPDQVAFRIDWPAFFATLTDRDRKLADFLAQGHSGTAAAARFGISSARVTQLRKHWRRNWLRYEIGGV